MRLMVAGSIAFQTITLLTIHAQKFEPTPQILHDRDPKLNPRQSRHNKAIAFPWYFLPLFFFVVVLMLILGSAKGMITLMISDSFLNLVNMTLISTD